MRMIRKLLSWFRNVGTAQTCFCYCECGNELCGDEGSDCYDRGNGQYAYICSKCKVQSLFDFNYPVPILIERIAAPEQGDPR